MTYENGRIAGRLLSLHAGRGTVRGLGHFAPRSDQAELVSIMACFRHYRIAHRGGEGLASERVVEESIS